MHIVDERIEKARAMFCIFHCPYQKECINCLAAKEKKTRRKIFKHMLAVGIPEELAREMIIGGKNL